MLMNDFTLQPGRCPGTEGRANLPQLGVRPVRARQAILSRPAVQKLTLHSSVVQKCGAAGAEDEPPGAPRNKTSLRAMFFTENRRRPEKIIKINVAAGPQRNDRRPRTFEVGSMVRKQKISSFAEQLNAAKSGDLSGWRPVYVISGGPKRYVLRDELQRVYDAYVCPDGSVKVYGPNMQAVG